MVPPCEENQSKFLIYIFLLLLVLQSCLLFNTITIYFHSFSLGLDKWCSEPQCQINVWIKDSWLLWLFYIKGASVYKYFFSPPWAVGDFNCGTFTVLSSATRSRAVTWPGATQTGAHPIHTVVIVAGLPWRPGAEVTIGSLVPQLENNRQPWWEWGQRGEHSSGVTTWLFYSVCGMTSLLPDKWWCSASTGSCWSCPPVWCIDAAWSPSHSRGPSPPSTVCTGTGGRRGRRMASSAYLGVWGGKDETYS